MPDASLAAPLPPRATADSDESAGLQVVQGFQPAVYADAAAAAADAQQLGSTGEQQNHSKQGLLSQQLQGQLATIIPCTQLPNAEAAEAAEAQPAVDTSNIGCTDLTEDLEELLVLGQQRHSAAASPSANADSTAGAVATSAGATPDHGSQESSTSSGYCWLALPAADAADVGMWQLGQFSSGSSSSSASGNPSTLPSIMLRQERTKERPSNGLCMAIALLRPQVGLLLSPPPQTSLVALQQCLVSLLLCRPRLLVYQHQDQGTGNSSSPHMPYALSHVSDCLQGSALHAVTGYEDGTVALWDTRNPTKYLASICSHSESIMCLAVAANCRLGFSGSADESLAAFDLSIPKGKITSAQKLALAGKPGISDVAIRPDGRIAASAGWDGKIRVWHARKRQPLAVLRWHSQQVASVSFSSDSRLLAAGGRDNNISLWSLYPPDA